MKPPAVWWSFTRLEERSEGQVTHYKKKHNGVRPTHLTKTTTLFSWLQIESFGKPLGKRARMLTILLVTTPIPKHPKVEKSPCANDRC